MIDHRAAEGVAMARGLHRLVEATPHHAGGPRQVRDPAGIDHDQHLLEALVERAELIGDSALEHDLAARHGAAAELVLEAHDTVGVAAAVRQRFRHQEQAKAPAARDRAFRPRQQHRQLGIDIRTEPFFAEQPPMLPVANGGEIARTDIGTAGLLRHKLRAAVQARQILRPHGIKVARFQFVAAEPAHQLRGAVGEIDRA